MIDVGPLTSASSSSCHLFISICYSVLTQKVFLLCYCRCGIQFLPDQNQMKSCRFHGFEDGTQGCFILEQGFSGKHWTCCGDPHKGKVYRMDLVNGDV